MHIRALAGANVVHLFIFRRALLLFQVAHVGGLFLLGLSLDSLAMMQNQCQAWLNHALYVVFSPAGQKTTYTKVPFQPHQLSISSSALAVASSSSPPPSLASVTPAQARHVQVSLRPSDAAMRSAVASSW